MLDILANFCDFNMLSTAHDCSLKCYEAILSHFTRLLKKPDYNHNDVVGHWLLNQVSNLDKHHLDESTQQILKVNSSFLI